MRRLSLIVLLFAGLAVPASVAYAVNGGGDGGGGGACDYVYGVMPSTGGTATAICTASFETGWRGTTLHGPNCNLDLFAGRIYHVINTNNWELRFSQVWCSDGLWHWSNAWPNNEYRVSQMTLYCGCAYDMTMLRR